MKKGFTMVEILVVVAILGLIMSVFVYSFSSAPEKANKANCYNFIKQVETALGMTQWTPRLYSGMNAETGLDEITAYPIASKLEFKTKDGKMIGHGRFGIVSPWAQNVIKEHGSSASLSTRIPSGGTVRDHRLRYALDADEDGIVEAVVGGESIRIRANVAVWCSGADGKIEPYSEGIKSDDVYSWTNAQVDRQ